MGFYSENTPLKIVAIIVVCDNVFGILTLITSLKVTFSKNVDYWTTTAILVRCIKLSFNVRNKILQPCFNYALWGY